ncbi:pyridine nucleotide-disulfide oxidoreductase [Sporocytophaga myxococcoides]|uniref:Pyridine nucleotide-disulfide oxidoreductase n=2 Tax=Sporocytophaga myxococcoides TaxID=153721 RepID=A0A098LC27_9BACT|nr:pyridine nucleotide-disulfide oxidoreductase [Sporocytophaga myxococcoides]
MDYYDCIIVGGSYSGLSAAMALGRSLRNVLIIDDGKPCNATTPHSHNFITHDGKKPAEITAIAKQQVEQYKTVNFYTGFALKGTKLDDGFQIETKAGDIFKSKKMIFATGIRDVLPAITGFSACWGISVIHCPYCHGYEFRESKTAILSNGDMAFHFSQLIYNLTKDLTLITNGKSELTAEQTEKLQKNNISVIEKELAEVKHKEGYLEEVIFTDGSTIPLKALYVRLPFEQHSDIPALLGCEITDQGFIKVDAMQKTTVPGVFVCGDNSSFMRSVANAVSSGNMAGAAANRELCEAEF